MHIQPKRFAPIVILLVLSGTALWYLNQAQSHQKSGQLSASGTIEAVQIKLASEIGGKVMTVNVEEGDPVSAGQVLVTFDDKLLLTQIEQARAALSQAQANYDLIARGPTTEQRKAAIAAASAEVIAAEQALKTLYENADLLAAKALQEIALADRAIDAATKRHDSLVSPADQTDIDAARAAVVLAKDILDKAQEAFEPYEKKPEDNVIRATLLRRVSEARNQYDAAVTRLNNMLGEVNDIELAMADADLALAQAQKADAERRYAFLKDGPDPDDVLQAKARLEAARANLELARAKPGSEEVALAQAQVDAARAALAVLEAQLERLQVVSPIDGIVLERAIQPGEVAVPSSTLLTLARLDDLTITVFIPEDRYGTINLGDTAQVTVDSLPGEVFEARVVHIADRAEYTPRNVQTQEGRKTTVFAIKLTVDNPDGQLKPGMPADVIFYTH